MNTPVTANNAEFPDSYPRMEAIILAGGLGTRLRAVLADQPKCMAPVAGKPFLHYVIEYLLKQGVQQFIFSLGYLSEVIEKYLLEQYPGLQYQLSVEKEPLGTGGAIQAALHLASMENVLVVNGDTMFAVDIPALLAMQTTHQADCTLCLKPMKDFDRYGVVELNELQQVISFKEKQFYAVGNINGGVYAINRQQLLATGLPEKFSFEKDYLEKKLGDGSMYGLLQDRYFIDIGIPEDYQRAQSEFIDFNNRINH